MATCGDDGGDDGGGGDGGGGGGVVTAAAAASDAGTDAVSLEPSEVLREELWAPLEAVA